MERHSRNATAYGAYPTSPLKLCRVVAGLSQAQLSDQAGIARETVCLLERGKHEPRWHTAAALSRALGVSDPRVLFPEAFPNDSEPRAIEPEARETSGAGVAGHEPD